MCLPKIGKLFLFCNFYIRTDLHRIDINAHSIMFQTKNVGFFIGLDTAQESTQDSGLAAAGK